MLIGIIGKPSSGKSTLLNALCLTDAKMGNYPFTTIESNRGVAYVRVNCPCKNLKHKCNPRSGKCEEGNRYVGVELLDVAGLVPGASSGKGMGNRFLDDIRRADILIHVVDGSGTTDAEGNAVDDYDPIIDIKWLNDELTAWVSNILYKDWEKISRRLDINRTKAADVISEKLSGLGATINQVKAIINSLNLLEVNPTDWTNQQKKDLSLELRKKLMPLIVAGNKIDRPKAPKKIAKIKEKYNEMEVVETTGLAELVLRKADEKGWIKYFPGETTFEILLENDQDKRLKTVLAIKEKLFDHDKSTGVMELLETCVFKFLNLISVFPVEDPTHYTDHDGRILPDVFFVQKGTTAKEFAGKIHSDLKNSFINGILANKSNQRISATYELEDGDVIKIVSAAK